MRDAVRFGVSCAVGEKGVLAIGNVMATQGDDPDMGVASAIQYFEPTPDKAMTEVRSCIFTVTINDEDPKSP